MKKVWWTLLLLVCQLGCKKEQLDFKYTGEYYLDYSTHIAEALQGIQQTNNHLWQRAGWWNCANIFEALLDYSKNSGLDYSSVCKKLYSENVGQFRGGFKNRALDDNEWWALAWLKAYDLYGDERYRAVAEDVFADMVNEAWDEQCGGGVVWKSTKRYKNAITNELFITLAARLASHQTQPWRKAYYLDWALRGWQWFDKSGMINANMMINDGLDDNCNNNLADTWTYNQGVILGGLKELYLLTKDTKYLDKAKLLAAASMQKLSDANGILSEPCTDCGGVDVMQFKGAYIRYLSELNVVVKDGGIKMYIIKNADSALLHAQNGQYLFDLYWQGPYDDWTAGATGVALDLMNAATLQSRLP